MRISDWSSDVCSSDLLMYAIESATYLAQIDEINASIARAEAPLQLANIHTQRPRELVSRQVKAQSTLDESVAKKPRAVQIGRASCRARVCISVSFSVFSLSLHLNNLM